MTQLRHWPKRCPGCGLGHVQSICFRSRFEHEAGAWQLKWVAGVGTGLPWAFPTPGLLFSSLQILKRKRRVFIKTKTLTIIILRQSRFFSSYMYKKKKQCSSFMLFSVSNFNEKKKISKKLRGQSTTTYVTTYSYRVDNYGMEILHNTRDTYPLFT